MRAEKIICASGFGRVKSVFWTPFSRGVGAPFCVLGLFLMQEGRTFPPFLLLVLVEYIGLLSELFAVFVRFEVVFLWLGRGGSGNGPGMPGVRGGDARPGTGPGAGWGVRPLDAGLGPLGPFSCHWAGFDQDGAVSGALRACFGPLRGCFGGVAGWTAPVFGLGRALWSVCSRAGMAGGCPTGGRLAAVSGGLGFRSGPSPGRVRAVFGPCLCCSWQAGSAPFGWPSRNSGSLLHEGGSLFSGECEDSGYFAIPLFLCPPLV